MHPEDRELVDRTYRLSRRDRMPYDRVHRLLMPDGRIKHVHEQCETTYDEQGRAIRSPGTTQDATDLKLAEQKLREYRVLKIDGGFVRDINRDPMSQAIVEAINRVGHVVGLETIAELVETEEIRQALVRIGVDYAQGYGLHRPEPMSGFDAAASR